LDEAHNSPDPDARQAADDRLGLLTPMLKGMFTDAGFANAVKAQQVLGGHGYVCEWGMEQFVRDARITMIYEGANGIQALDLVGRKLFKDGARAMTAFVAEARDCVNDGRRDPSLEAYVAPLKTALWRLEQATAWIADRARAEPNEVGAASTEYGPRSPRLLPRVDAQALRLSSSWNIQHTGRIL